MCVSLTVPSKLALVLHHRERTETKRIYGEVEELERELRSYVI